MLAASLAAALGGGACLDHELPPDGEGVTTFIALQRDFAPFESWAAFDLGPGSIEGHPTGRRTVYLNRIPEPGSEVFPVGTMIVKTVEDGPVTDWIVHAMVKRGAEFNVRGARGWEWFELGLAADRTPILVWRGEEPPNGERYGCLSGSCEGAPDCNQCHASASANDYVASAPLSLRDL